MRKGIVSREVERLIEATTIFMNAKTTFEIVLPDDVIARRDGGATIALAEMRLG